MYIIEPPGTDAAFHFAAEEFIMRNEVKPGNSKPVIMLWQANNTAMLGVNQIADAEINMPAAQAAGVNIVRRQSGGGTIYTDMGSLLYTFILPHNEAVSPMEVLRKIVAAPFAAALESLGISAAIEGRNDITVNEKKISGLAQYVKNNKICTHGSLLYDTNLEFLAKLLTPNADKFKSKALASVRGRVGNVKDYVKTGENGEKPTILEVWGALKQFFQNSLNVTAYDFTAAEIAKINAIRAEKYANDKWTFGRTPKFTFTNSRRFEGGVIEVFFDVQNGMVADCSIRGDFLGVSPINELEARLTGRAFNSEAIKAALNETPPEPYLGGITADEFLACAFSS